MSKDDGMKTLDAVLIQIEKVHGKGSVVKLGDSGVNMSIEMIPTDSPGLDIALGLGGVPRGRMVEVYGPESSGKTTVALHMVAEAQKRDGIAGFIDMEHALDLVCAESISMDIDNLYISQPDNGGQALEITGTMVRSEVVDIAVADSVAAPVPRAEIDGDMGDSHVGLQARPMSQRLRKLTGHVSKSNCMVILINQLCERIGVMFGNPETTTSDRTLKSYASVRLDMRKIETLKQGGEMIGDYICIKVIKDKVAPPFKEAEFDTMFGKGTSKEDDVLDSVARGDIAEKSGVWYAYDGVKIGQGRENAKIYLRDDPAMYQEIEDKVREHYRLGHTGGSAPAPAAGAASETRVETLRTGGAGKAAKASEAETSGELKAPEASEE